MEIFLRTSVRPFSGNTASVEFRGRLKKTKPPLSLSCGLRPASLCLNPFALDGIPCHGEKFWMERGFSMRKYFVVLLGMLAACSLNSTSLEAAGIVNADYFPLALGSAGCMSPAKVRQTCRRWSRGRSFARKGVLSSFVFSNPLSRSVVGVRLVT